MRHSAVEVCTLARGKLGLPYLYSRPRRQDLTHAPAPASPPGRSRRRPLRGSRLSACGADDSDDDSADGAARRLRGEPADVRRARNRPGDRSTRGSPTTRTTSSTRPTTMISRHQGLHRRGARGRRRRRPSRCSPTAATTGRPSSRSPDSSLTVDGAVDSRVDDFASVDDPAFTGWHRLEYILWEQGKLDCDSDASIATSLDEDLAPLPDLLAESDDDSQADVAHRRRRPDRRGQRGQAHRRGGPLLPHRPLRPGRQRERQPARLPGRTSLCSPRRRQGSRGQDRAGLPRREVAAVGDYQRADGSYESYLELHEGRQAATAGHAGHVERRPVATSRESLAL